MNTTALPSAFVWRRVHSLMGLWLVLFLMEHLLTNSQAALLLGDNGRMFVQMVNALHNLPFLPVIEIVLLGVPFAVHMVWGLQRLFTAKSNSKKSDGSTPDMRGYGRNHAYTWQRISSWILLFGIIGHVVQFRFLDLPVQLNQGKESFFFVRVEMDRGLYTVAERLGVALYDQAAVAEQQKLLDERSSETALLSTANMVPVEGRYDEQKALLLLSAQHFEQKQAWVRALSQLPLKDDEVIAEAKDFGTASLLTVRNTFKSPLYVGLYTIFVLAACFHGFNGLWTALLTWGVVLKVSAQKAMLKGAWALMAIVTFLGLAAIWGTYWLNLKN